MEKKRENMQNGNNESKKTSFLYAILTFYKYFTRKNIWFFFLLPAFLNQLNSVIQKTCVI